MAYQQKNQNTNYSKLYMNTGVVSNNKSVSQNMEKATILSKAFDIASKEHIDLEFKLFIVGVLICVLSVIPVILGGMGNIDIIGTIIGTLILVIIGIFIIVYGFFIHKPHEITTLSKVYTINHIIPYKSALLFDGTDIIPDQIIEYKDIPLEEIQDLSGKLPNPPTSYENERNLMEILSNKKELTNKLKQYKFKTPIVENNNQYVNAVLDCIPYCIDGEPYDNPLEEKISIEDSIRHKQEIEKLEEAEKIIKLMNQEKGIINNKSAPFVNNLTKAIKNIEVYISNISILIKNRLFGEYNINSNPLDDAEYGYEYVDCKYHIKVGSSNGNNLCFNPINTYQRVIDHFDGNVKKEISRIIEDGKERIKDKQDWADSEVNRTEQFFKTQIDSKQSEVLNYETQADSAYEQYRSYESQYEECMSNVKSYENMARRAMRSETSSSADVQRYQMQAQNERNQANNYQMQANNFNSQYETAKSRVSSLEMEIEGLENQKENEIDKIRNKEQMDIKDIENKMEKKVIDSRKFINNIIEKRNHQIEMFNEFSNNLLGTEKKVQSTPFINRKNIIINLRESILKSMDKRIKERSNVLGKINSYIIQTNVNKPTTVAIPYWIMELNKKKIGKEIIVFPPLKMVKPTKMPTSRWKYINFSYPLSKSLENSTNLLKNYKFVDKSKKVSIAGRIDKQIGIEINNMVSQGYLSQGYANRINKHYNILPVGGAK